jgi:hypothetical protein
MAGARTSRGRPLARAVATLTAGLGAAGVLPAASVAEPPTTVAAAVAAPRDSIRLPGPIQGIDPLATVDLGLRPDRLRTSVVPGPVRNTEDVRVALGPTGAPATVTDTQRLVIRGAGNYIVRELGPAREAESLGGTSPVLQLGTVIWQGFSPGRRVLAARLTLDPGIEAARLPLGVTFEFRTADGRRIPLRPGGVAPADGTVTLTLHNGTSTTRAVDAGTAEPAPLARVLDRLRVAADHPREAVPPVAGDGLPRAIPGHRDGQVALPMTSPLRVTGEISAPGGATAITGPATTPTDGGVQISGTLTGEAMFTVRLARGDRLGLALQVRPWLDPRTLTPPDGFRSWSRWAAADPSTAAVRRATSTAVAAAAAAARSAEYSPYLQADAPGDHLSTFTYVMAPASAAAPTTGDDMQPRPGGIAAAAVAFLAVIGNAALLRRHL